MPTKQAVNAKKKPTAGYRSIRGAAIFKRVHFPAKSWMVRLVSQICALNTKLQTDYLSMSTGYGKTDNQAV